MILKDYEEKRKIWKIMKSDDASFKNLIDKYRYLKLQIKKKLTNIRINYQKNVFETRNSNPKIFYKFINKYLGSKNTNIKLLNHSGKLIFEPIDICQTLNEYFLSVFVKPNENVFDINLESRSDFVSINSKDVKEMAEKLSASTATGADEISAYFLKNLFQIIPDTISHLFSNFLNMGFVPDDWKVANVCPIYKKGCDKTLPNAYRPVSITSVISRFFEQII